MIRLNKLSLVWHKVRGTEHQVKIELTKNGFKKEALNTFLFIECCNEVKQWCACSIHKWVIKNSNYCKQPKLFSLLLLHLYKALDIHSFIHPQV